MIKSVRNDLLFIMEGVNQAFSVYDPGRIMELSDHIIHSASVYQDKYSIQAATFVYALGKVIAKGKVRRFPQSAWESFKKVVKSELKNAINYLKRGKDRRYDLSVRHMQDAIKRLDTSFKQYVETVLDKAKLKKGVKIYEHGISLKKVSEMIGVSEWELMDYAGKTMIVEQEHFESRVKDRLDRARRLFE